METKSRKSCIFYKSSPKAGISLVVLMITIVVMIILVSVITVSARNSINDARLSSFASDLFAVEDAVKAYYFKTNEMPYPDDNVVLHTKDQIKTISGEENAEYLEQELAENHDNNESTIKFYYVDLAKIDVERTNTGLGKEGENDVYVVSYPTLDVYYLKGIVVDGKRYFSLTSKISDMTKIRNGDNEEDDNSSVSVVEYDGITVSRETGWTSTMPMTVKTDVKEGQTLHLSLSGIEKNLVTSTGLYARSFNLSDLLISNDVLASDSQFTEAEISTFNQLTQDKKYVEILKKDVSNNIIGRNKIDISNFEQELPTISKSEDINITFYPNSTMVNFKAMDNISKIKDIRFDYLSKIDENGLKTSYYEGIDSFDITYMKQKGKPAKVGTNGDVNISIPKNVKEVVVVIIDNANNWIMQTININNLTYIGSTVDTATSQSIKVTANVYSDLGLNQLKFSISTDAQNFTGEQVFTYNSNNLLTTQQLEFPGMNISKAYVKIEAIDNNSIIANRKSIIKLQTVEMNGGGGSNPDNPQNTDITIPQDAVINVEVSGGNVVGTIAMLDNEGGSGIDLTNSRYMVTSTSTPYSVNSAIWFTTEGKVMSNNPASISETKADGNYYVQVLSVDKAGNKKVTVSSNMLSVHVKIGNPPVLSAGMTPIKWDASGNLVTTTADDNNWYDYGSQKWANSQTADGSMWVWIPRYEYMITTPHSSTTQVIAVNFLNGTSTTATSGYIVHPAFTFGTTELTGLWVAKFEASGTTSAVDVKSGIASLKNITIGDMYTACRNMESNARYGWGTSGTNIDTHLMKNIEWGAAAYLSDSRYGKNGVEVGVNTNSSFITGGGTGIVYATTNVGQSTSGNVYGIYDMSGGAQEYVAAYVATLDGGTSLLNADSKYKDVYTGTTATFPDNVYSSASSKKGDAMYETSTGTSSNYYDNNGGRNIYGSSLSSSWFNDYSNMPGYVCNTYYTGNYGLFGGAIIRGGANSSGVSAGIFSFMRAFGSSDLYLTFRPVLAIATGL